jgi:hypothetical protein
MFGAKLSLLKGFSVVPCHYAPYRYQSVFVVLAPKADVP